MKFYSDITEKLYDSADELRKAEELVEKAKKEKEALQTKRAERAKEVEAAFEKVAEAQKEANKLLNEFCKDYGSFHMSYHSGDNFANLLDNWLSLF